VRSIMDPRFLDAARCDDPVTGLTHRFYRYPAQFSPKFARAAIMAFTQPDDTVLDPFMGGGTTLVEACALGRRAVGTDINSLSVFVSRVKTTVLSDHDLGEVLAWADLVVNEISLHDLVDTRDAPIDRRYQRNISDKRTWPIRKMLEMALPRTKLLATEYQRRFARCVLLKTAQWALDCRKDVPRVGAFRKRVIQNVVQMSEGARKFALATAGQHAKRELAACIHRPASEIGSESSIATFMPPRLILTSPPYPGVHVLYHRWQVQGRRETPAPYWIADSFDGRGATFYTFGDRKQHGLTAYYDSAYRAFNALSKIADAKTTVVQLVAFSDPAWQLPKYLATMKRAGFAEIVFRCLSDSPDGRLWRKVPHRKFYADQKGNTMASNEVVLFHHLA